MRLARIFLSLLLLAFLSGPSWAQWITEAPPANKASSYAALAPADSKVVMAWSLQGHINLKQMTKDVLANLAELDVDPEKQLKSMGLDMEVSFLGFLDLFTGNGFLALMEQEVQTGPEPSVVAAVELNKPQEFSQFLNSLAGEEIQSRTRFRDFEIIEFKDDAFVAALGRNWVVVSNELRDLKGAIDALRGGRTLASNYVFRKALADMPVIESGAFFWVEGDGATKLFATAAGIAELSDVEKTLGFWDYGVVSVDFLHRQTDGLLAYKEGDSPLLNALRAPGRTDGTLLRFIPQMSTTMALDVSWFRNVAFSLGKEVPELSPMVDMANAQFNALGELFLAFDGRVAMGTDVLDSFGKLMLGMRIGSGRNSVPSFVAIADVNDPVEAHKILTAATKRERVRSYVGCQSNLKNMGTALEMYSTDWSGHYPDPSNLKTALTPNYLRTMPKCPQAGRDTYSKSYQIGPDAPGNDDNYQDYYNFYCQGKNHKELDKNRPRYNGIVGLITGPVREIADDAPAIPPRQDRHRYEADSEVSFVLDSPKGLALVSAGDRKEELLKAVPNQVLRPLIADSLLWGGDQIVMLSYADINGMYNFAYSFLAKDSSDPQMKVALNMLKDFKNWIGDLQDVQCVKATKIGLRYRGRGYASTPMVGSGTAIAAAIMVPNFVRARGQGQFTACKSNLKNIGTALEMWSVDYDGDFPEKLEELTPNYLRVIPECPTAGVDTYSGSYTHTDGTKQDPSSGKYEFFCRGHHHNDLGVPQDHPRYNSLEGLISR